MVRYRVDLCVNCRVLLHWFIVHKTSLCLQKAIKVSLFIPVYHAIALNFPSQPEAKKAKKGAGKKKGKGSKKGKGKGKKKSTAVAEKKSPPVPDPLSYAALLNAYYIAHGPVEFLQFRGYGWSGGRTKKKKKGGKKKK